MDCLWSNHSWKLFVTCSQASEALVWSVESSSTLLSLIQRLLWRKKGAKQECFQIGSLPNPLLAVPDIPSIVNAEPADQHEKLRQWAVEQKLGSRQARKTCWSKSPLQEGVASRVCFLFYLKFLIRCLSSEQSSLSI